MRSYETSDNRITKMFFGDQDTKYFRRIDGPANVRKEPKGSIIGEIQDTEKVVVFEKQENWFLIQTLDGMIRGWTYKSNIGR